jgi:hypothetical protein
MRPKAPLLTLQQLLDRDGRDHSTFAEVRSGREARRQLLASIGIDLDSLREGVAKTTIVDSDRDVVLLVPLQFAGVNESNVGIEVSNV